MGVALEERVHLLRVTIDDDAAYATKLPRAAEAVGRSSSCMGCQIAGFRRGTVYLRWSPKPMSSVSMAVVSKVHVPSGIEDSLW